MSNDDYDGDQRWNEDPFNFLIKQTKERNFKTPHYLEIYILDDIKIKIDKLKYYQTLKIVCHDYKLRKEIHSYCEKYNYISNTTTDQRINFDRNSTILKHLKCNKNIPYKNLKWGLICDDTVFCICPHCDDKIYADNYCDCILSKRHNLMIIKKSCFLIIL